MLVEDLIKNNYLITPPAYYLLEPHYRKDFTLAELIKFVKARGSFVVTSAIAEEFLASKGLVSTGNEAPSLGETPPDVAEEQEDNQGVSPQEHEPAEPSKSSGSSSLDEPSPESESFVSTGNAVEQGISQQFSGSKGGVAGLSSEGESLISTGTSGPSVVEEAGGDGETLVEGIREEDVFPVEIGGETEYEPNGNGSAEENGNGIKPKVVYGDYGVPIAYVEEEIPEEKKSYSVYEDVVVSPKEGFHYRAVEIPEDAEVVFDVKNFKFSPPKAKNAAGKEGEFLVEAYRAHFRSRLRRMRNIFRENPEIGGIIDIGKLSYVQPNTDVTIVGMVNEKKETAKGFVLELEDSTGRIKVFINREREDAKLVMEIMHDSVIAVTGRYSGRGIIFADRLYIPDVPRFRRRKPPLKEKVYAILLSDIHVGSNKFCEEAFVKFLEWLNGDVENEVHAELVSRVKYLIIAGDVVDGVGIYPGQYDELKIPDIFDQYEALYNLLRNVPKHIHTFIGPGNHDAARTALPQPGFYEEYARPLFKLKNTTIISNPAVIRLHGRDFLIAHGRGIEDVVTEIPNRSHHRPAEAMINLLKLRHLAPTFGEKVPIAPDPEDLLVIENVPDLFQAGHVHVLQHKVYNGVFLINTGTWQAQTEFQKMVNIQPTPAVVPIIDVETARLRAVVRFDQFCEGV
ncbi:DNA polymerase II [Thermococcus profundus]|uniref:DNA polymerase II small subunit n=1 Tax=Thermococcus profundus TaxID=49899 RepID=A0A2Z2MIV6_THEPR|nr:DNA-directed DNA polymerase II small subunit [Thermococcus profundus]ASJ01888.1 DNA polymerase II [Thermococcus profundus]